nr:MAG TPA: Protein of unknown function (DUF1223) [Caudoviricetes sp.]
MRRRRKSKSAIRSFTAVDCPLCRIYRLICHDYIKIEG